MAKAVSIRRVLATNVRRLRLAKGLSQDARAADAGLFQKLISGSENGRANPEPPAIMKGRRF
jgi:transcriptional regulator with XRE-family HTH domain